jgi:cobyrinic acid a,c-diamide synthase
VTLPAPRGLIIAAPRSGSGKTVLTLGLLRALRRRGHAVASAKVGPDYIDPAFHAAATGRPCVSLDTWAMRPASVAALVAGLDGAPAVIEGVMGLFDGAQADHVEGDGSTASLAAETGWPVVLVLDVSGQAGSAAAVARGFATHRPEVGVAGVVLNRVGGPRHEDGLRRAFADGLPGLPLLGCVPRDGRLDLPHRHLGLVQAAEHGALEGFVDAAADLVERHLDVAALDALATPPGRLAPAPDGAAAALLPPPGQRIAVARDVAFAFAYPAQEAAWRAAGAEVRPFSPLANQAPATDCDTVYLPGGYPELHAGRLAAATVFLDGLRGAAARGATVYGECGGYMVLGRTLVDANGTAHAMAGLLGLDSSFAARRLHLGYRRATAAAAMPFGPTGTVLRGHEFHYASIVAESGTPLFHGRDAGGRDLGPMGLRRGTVCGSFLHAIDLEGPARRA